MEQVRRILFWIYPILSHGLFDYSGYFLACQELAILVLVWGPEWKGDLARYLFSAQTGQML